MEVALSTGIPPADLLNQPDDVIITMADIFEERHRAAEEAKSKSKRDRPRRTGRKGR